MFDADRPIQSSAEDRLGRTVFAKSLARCILDHHNTECLTIGLYGGWGTGKTSIINLTLEELHFAASNMFDQEKPIILNFSPWSYSGQNQLIYSFFRRLSSEIRRAEYFDQTSPAIHLLELYISFFTHKPVPKYLRPKHAWWNKWTQPQVTAEESIGWESGRDLTLVKAELNQALRAQKHKIIIFIDNIARLDSKEINEIFQIVKSIGDMANVVYVLALDQGHIISALNQLQGGGGVEFLHKVIQLPFEIPVISKQDLETLLLDRLEVIVTTIPEGSWERNYWAEVYYSSLKYFFEHVRDITRYVNTLGFSYEHVKEVVNPVDFFAMTALQIFEPDVFFGVRDNKDLFTDLADDVAQFEDEQTVYEEKRRIDEITHRSKKIPSEMSEQLLMCLFPRLRKILRPEIYYYHSKILARKNRRMCSLDMFDVYFRLTIPSGTMAEDEFNAILTLSSDRAAFALALLRINQDNRIDKFLDLLDSVGIYKIAKENIIHVICAFMDSGDLFPEGEQSILHYDVHMRIHRICHQLLRRFDQSGSRFKMLHEAIQKSVNSIYTIVYELKEQEREHIESEETLVPIEHRDFNQIELTELKQAAVNKIRDWAEQGRLVAHPKLLSILYAWNEWGDSVACKNYVMQISQEDKGLLALLLSVFKGPIKEALTKGQSHSNPLWAKYMTDLEAFIEPTALVPHAQALFESDAFEKLRDTEQLALLIFLNAAAPNTVKTFPKTV